MKHLVSKKTVVVDFDLIDSKSDSDYDDLIELAQRLFKAETAVISLFSENKVFFKGCPSFQYRCLDIDESICALTVASRNTLIIPDLAADQRTSQRLRDAKPRLRFYAGSPLYASDGVIIGSFCVIDSRPRKAGLTENEIKNLEILARQASLLIEMRRMASRQDIMKQELIHRGKNLFTMIQAVVSQTMRHAVSIPSARTSLRARLTALGAANDILVNHDQEADITSLIDSAKRAYDVGDRIITSGPEIKLDGKKAVSISMILHELATNSLKYGALSEDGEVHVSWSLDKEFVFDWIEKGGPKVIEPSHQGFGTKLLQMGLPMEGSVGTLTYAPEGLRYRVGALVDS